MENNSTTEAKELLASLDTDRGTLADKLVTPWWYHPILGACYCLILIPLAFPNLSLAIFGILGPVLLLRYYETKYGISVRRPQGRRSWTLIFGLIGILVASAVAATAIRLTDVSGWWVLVVCAVTWISIVVLGRSYDAALRSEIRS